MRGPLLLGTASLATGACLMLWASSSSGIALLALVCVCFGLPNGVNLIANQIAVLRLTPTDQTGIASGFFRTSQYIGAMCATGLVAVTFGARATDEGLDRLALSFVVIATGLLVGRVIELAIAVSRSRQT